MWFKNSRPSLAKPSSHRYFLPAIAMLTAGSLAGNAHAAVSGTYVGVFTGDWWEYAPYYGDGGLGISASAVNEGHFTPINIDESFGGTAASAALNGPSNLPTLKIKTLTHGNAFRDVTAYAIQAFDVLAHGSNILNISFSGQADGRAEADIIVFKDSMPSGSDDEISDVAFQSVSSIGEIFCCSPNPGRYTMLDDYWHGGIGKDYYDDGTYQTMSDSLNLSGYAPGDVVYVWVKLTAFARNGTSVDASHTLSMSWDNPSQFSAIAAVPEPTTYAMFLTGLGLLGFMRRRSTKQAILG